MAVASARTFSQPLAFTEATRLDWDSFKLTPLAGVFAANTNLDAIVPGRGTWHIQALIADRSSDISQAVFTLRTVSVNGFVYDMCCTSFNGFQMMEAVIAVGPVDEVLVSNLYALPAGFTGHICFLSKRLTR